MVDIKKGSLVYSKTGHDKNMLYIVVGVENDRVLLANGKLRRLENLKRKNIKHVAYISYKDEELAKLIENEKATDEDIKLAIKNYYLLQYK